MIEFNGHSYSGNIIREDGDEIVASIYSVETLQDICIALTDVKSITESVLNGATSTHKVTAASHVARTANNCYTVTFSKKRDEIEALNEAIDSLLVMVLEG